MTYILGKSVCVTSHPIMGVKKGNYLRLGRENWQHCAPVRPKYVIYGSHTTHVMVLLAVRTEVFSPKLGPDTLRGNPDWLAQHSRLFFATVDKSMASDSWLRNMGYGALWTVLQCCLGHSRNQVWKTASIHKCSAWKPSKSKSREASWLNKPDSIFVYCIQFCERTQRLQTNRWSAIMFNIVYDSW